MMAGAVLEPLLCKCMSYLAGKDVYVAYIVYYINTFLSIELALVLAIMTQVPGSTWHASC